MLVCCAFFVSPYSVVCSFRNNSTVVLSVHSIFCIVKAFRDTFVTLPRGCSHTFYNLQCECLNDVFNIDKKCRNVLLV